MLELLLFIYILSSLILIGILAAMKLSASIEDIYEELVKERPDLMKKSNINSAKKLEILLWIAALTPIFNTYVAFIIIKNTKVYFK